MDLIFLFQRPKYILFLVNAKQDVINKTLRRKKLTLKFIQKKL